ncbi:MAG TPA: GGDEF domain-containing protein [Gammaproteobacteria bacterium]|jgi:diguanylate cyclase (GGDEF) domain|nr:GGDEF domain-containing protein [Gammaproteobacteria bacterium]HCO60870.1 GGDEF domain-containing protein [Porticoccaceae bacterium]
MQKPNIPKDEQFRLQTLHSLSILDTPAENRFDCITRMAKRLFNVPIALVSLVDENRQWFKSSIGLEASETPRDISFCGHAILSKGIFIVPNALEDERFSDNPLVLKDPYIRFYAGYPLKALNGQQLGTLCLIDRKPRTLDDGDLATLKDLASTVERELAAIELATVDELTRVSNRRGFSLLASHCLRLCTRQKLPASLVYFDLDNFKPINDRFGHAEGDKALVAFADQLKGACRDSDIPVRLGGDEFALLLINTTLDIAEGFISRFKESVDTYNESVNRGYDILFSHGIVAFDHQKPSTIQEMLTEGDAEMYRRKQLRKNHSTCESTQPGNKASAHHIQPFI